MRYLTIRIHQIHDLGEPGMIQMESDVLVVVVGHSVSPAAERTLFPLHDLRTQPIR